MEKSRFLKWVLAGGIVIVLNLFFNYSIALVYDNPNYDTFCPRAQVTKAIETQEECVAVGGAWTEHAVFDRGPIVSPETPQPKGWCDEDFTCRQGYEDARSAYEQNVFIILIVLGVLSIVVSFAVTPYEAVSLGLSLGGVLSFIIGSTRYWDSAPDIIKVAILAVALGALIWLGIKKVRD